MGKHYQKSVKPNEKSELRFILSPPPKGKFASGGKYSAHVEHDQTLGEETVIRELADSIQPPLQKEFVALVIHLLSDYVADRLKRGYHLNFGGFNIGYSITGGFDAANTPFDPAKHKLNVIVSPRNCLKDSAAYMSPVNVTQTINPEITDVWCRSASGEQIFDRLHPGEDGFANGLAFAEGDKPKVDRLWIETQDGKTAVELTIKSCDATRMSFAVPGRIAAGEYILVAQRMNPDLRSFARARHKVKVELLSGE